jgi:hypothetical protein
MSDRRNIEGQELGVKLVCERHPVRPDELSYYVASPRHPEERPRFNSRTEALAYFDAEIDRVRAAG